MDSSAILSLLEQLDDEIDDLEESVAPLVKTALAETTSKLPLLDKAKLYVLVTYAIESMLFSYLRLNGVRARDHPVFIELTRVKQYFDKIKITENPPTRTSTLDKAAAARFLKPGLAAAEKHALEQAELRAKQRARAHIKFDELSKTMEDREKAKAPKRKPNTADATPEEDGSSSDSSSESASESAKDAPVAATLSINPKKKQKLDKQSDSAPTSGTSSPARKPKGSKAPKKAAKKQKKRKNALKE
ncbi:uncharacterized protein BP5553_06690 [Venustampulla echinocandica]|uniref:Exosome complex protein n=1 Tax=Venustampulla echinocandica TaxID=2656787 RepID=A0A370TKM7_9HELO|nr:uncharacterized protein BP5553_06690 [Venustampulla echinocandica]RDL36078.1 hypothetical protein BP5553_06690 [Venustampulla echinocandica]